MKKTSFAMAAVAVALSAAAPVGAAEAAYLTLQGQKQGTIKGDVTQKGREGTIEVLNLELGGTATGGNRKWDTLKFLKRVDVSTVNLVAAFTANETLTRATFRMYRSSTQGQEEQFFTIELTNAVVVSDRIKNVSLADGKPDTSPPVEEVALTFQKIAITYPSGGKSTQDDWHY